MNRIFTHSFFFPGVPFAQVFDVDYNSSMPIPTNCYYE